jgi:hypothetical protein
MYYTFTIHPRLHTTTTHSQTVSFPFQTVCALETNRQIFSPFRSAYRRLGAPALPTDIKDFVKDAPYPATIEVPKGSIRLGDVMAVMRYSVYTMHSRKRSSHTRLSYTPPIRSSHTLLSYAPLIHASHTLLSYTPLIHSSRTLLSYTPLVHSSHTLSQRLLRRHAVRYDSWHGGRCVAFNGSCSIHSIDPAAYTPLILLYTLLAPADWCLTHLDPPHHLLTHAPPRILLIASPPGPYGSPDRFGGNTNVNGGWERTIGTHHSIVSLVMEARSWLPDPIGGLL